MNPITPPTDSLYKFMTISGLIAMIAGCVFLFSSDEKKDESSLKYFGEEKVLQKEIAMLIDKIDYNKKYSVLVDSIRSVLVDSSKKAETLTLGDTLIVDKKIFYNLPDSIQNNFKHLILKREELIESKALIDSQNSTSESYKIVWWIFIFGGEVIVLIGLTLWYEKIEKPNKKKLECEHNKFLGRDLWQRECQSCYKTIHLMNERGTEYDGKYNRTYCKNCYEYGKFIEPDLQFQVAQERLKNEMKNLNYSKLRIRSYSKGLKKCIRWVSKTTW